METPSTVTLPALVTWCILVTCLFQSSYAEVCYLRSHMGYGGCIRWFLPAEEVPNCTSIKLGGYTTKFYKQNQIIEFDQPFISDNSDEVKKILEKRGVTMSPMTKTEASSEILDQSPGTQSISPTTDLLSQSAVTIRGDSSDSIWSTQSPSQPSTDQQFLSTTAPKIVCPSDLGRQILTCTGSCDNVVGCRNDETCHCRDNINETVEILTCGCNSSDTSSFIPMGLTHSNGTRKCHCNTDGTTVCNHDVHLDNETCNSVNDMAPWTCQIGKGKNQMFSYRPSGCQELYDNDVRENGMYCVYPNQLNNSYESPLKVYCHMGYQPAGGWTVIQRRVNGSVDFFRNWTEYKNGFGTLDHEFWLGNENIYHLTNPADMQLRIDINNDDGEYYALYHLFRIDSEDTGYKLIELGTFQPGEIVYDSLRSHVNAAAPFSTYDHDMDGKDGENCAVTNHGGWWFTNCHMCYLNGVYGNSSVPGIRWYNLPGGQYNIMSTEMKVRPVD